MGFIEAAVLGLGWCVAPELLIAPALHAKKLVVLNPERALDVPLSWQHAAVRSTVLDNVGAALREATRHALRA